MKSFIFMKIGLQLSNNLDMVTIHIAFFLLINTMIISP